ncbi:peptide deformylase [Actinacidiphila sp. ITFR-21]|uniref:peptide deformylase n=1 Tax=Actinacidiphila sp. ITFR-21 TaxID=3075199 RepID=UPI00288AC5B9|nr:peptide deformylase [Streptomyces sp. ITFR-21]WNI14175.1 peptide deformylase [Streptomyces sp. ITFR-21]
MRYGAIPGSTGTVHRLRLFGEPGLHTPCAEVTAFDGGLARLVEDMFATMYAAGGVGLAANQIGVPLRVFVYDCPDDEDRRHLGHLVNPRPVRTGGVEVTGAEGCLSLPGVECGTRRHDEAVVEGFDMWGGPVAVAGTGFFARCLQHECDHLEGTVFTDRLRGPRRARARWAVRRAARTGALPAGPGG